MTIQNKRVLVDRHLAWPNCYNARDLGGLPTIDGGETRSGVVIRSDILGRLTDEGRQAMLDYGVRTVLDLRGPEEAEKYRYDFGGKSAESIDLTYLNLPLEHFYPEVGQMIRNATSRGEVYCIIPDHYSDLTAEVVRSIINAKPGGVVIHCHAGKDRTGTITALLLRMAGVPMDVVAADYAESQERLRPLYEELIAEAGGEEKLGFWQKPTVTEEMMLIMLNHLDETYGGVERYLEWAGLSPDELTKLRDLLV
jgi:protein tyrosine/serine phosphatase